MYHNYCVTLYYYIRQFSCKKTRVIAHSKNISQSYTNFNSYRNILNPFDHKILNINIDTSFNILQYSPELCNWYILYYTTPCTDV